MQTNQNHISEICNHGYIDTEKQELTYFVKRLEQISI
jgi:hypothetical protein